MVFIHTIRWPDPSKEQKYRPRLYLMADEVSCYLPLERLKMITQFRPALPMKHRAKLADLFNPRDYQPSPAFLNDEPPEIVFPPRNNLSTLVSTRYCHRHDRRMLLIQADGACLKNGTDNASAGWAFVAAPPHPTDPRNTGIIAEKLEGEATSNRAEMMAVIVALRARHWQGEGFHTIVFATDSQYVVKGCTEWARKWQAQGWSNKKNVDLWKEMIWNLDCCKSIGLDVKFWWILRQWNVKADAAARKAAREG